MNGNGRLLILMAILLITAGCSHNILSANALGSVDFSKGYEAFLQNPPAYVGKTIILGGYISEYLISRDGTTLGVQPYTMNKQGMPVRLIQSAEEVLVRTDQILIPDKFGPGHMVTLTGTYVGREPFRGKLRMLFKIGEIHPLPPPAHYPYGYHYPFRIY